MWLNGVAEQDLAVLLTYYLIINLIYASFESLGNAIYLLPGQSNTDSTINLSTSYLIVLNLKLIPVEAKLFYKCQLEQLQELYM